MVPAIVFSLPGEVSRLILLEKRQADQLVRFKLRALDEDASDAQKALLQDAVNEHPPQTWNF